MDKKRETETGRPKDRPRPIGFHTTDDVSEKLTAKAERAGQSVSLYLHRLVAKHVGGKA